MLEGKRHLLKMALEMALFEARTEEEVWVSVSAPANSRLPIAAACSFHQKNIDFEFERGSNGLLCSVVASCKTDAELVPKLFSRAANGCDWTIIEPPDDRCTELMDALCRIEGYLAPFGLIGLDFRRLEWSWFIRNGASKRKLIFSFKLNFEPNQIRQSTLSVSDLTSLTSEALKGTGKALLTLSIFRMGEDLFQNCKYQEALRHFLLSLEHEFAEGKFRAADVEKIYYKSDSLVAAIKGAERHARYFVHGGDISEETVLDLLTSRTPANVIHWLVNLRGYLFHQSAKRAENWHPSLQISHKEEAILVRSILVTVIRDIVRGAT
ncbi:hypothetical protein [Jannaschia rubra]|uniref:Apea-like HEPN domain-containing protein n=2 Tax=Jannaschia rubra TaxID=282197 RepID=A0A0M6XNN3_9RHOB|nr:hypothetical protein [Jannaschia rubra]CTQ32197.1 hypothetical protein JAN5088_00960 [Jannaschia rubra]SFG35304.1 hypothetical protein SAMN04488517_10433 [Jannaschia rubra]